MLINLSNHPSSNWSAKQLNAALQYGKITDIVFPDVDPMGDEEYIEELSSTYLQNILPFATSNKVTVHIMGEMTFCFSLSNKLRHYSIICIASTSERIIKEIDSGKKEVTFQFKRFRKYV